MSQPKRYYFTSPNIKGVNMGVLIHEDDQAPFVKYADYAALQAENERLRKAGDALARAAEQSAYHKEDYNVIKAWLAAKETQP